MYQLVDGHSMIRIGINSINLIANVLIEHKNLQISIILQVYVLKVVCSINENNSIVYYNYSLIITIKYYQFLITFQVHVSAYTQCEYSLLKVNYVRDCPTDAVSWNKAAERMDCQSIKQNCSGLNPQQHVFQYHCVVNGWMNATLEVCAFNRSILGMCNLF